MTVKAEYFLFCEGKAVGDHGQLSLHNLFDKVYSDKFPAAQKPFIAVARLIPVSKALVNKSLKIKITSNLNGAELTKLEVTLTEITVEENNGIVPSFDLSQFAYPEPGDYKFKLFVNDKEIASKILQVRNTRELSEV